MYAQTRVKQKKIDHRDRMMFEVLLILLKVFHFIFYAFILKKNNDMQFNETVHLIACFFA